MRGSGLLPVRLASVGPSEPTVSYPSVLWIVNSFVGTESRGRRQLPVRLLCVTVIRRVPTGCSLQFALVLAAGYPGAPQTRSPCDAFVTQDHRWVGARPTLAVDAELRLPLA
jgi:hypothetical protein